MISSDREFFVAGVTGGLASGKSALCRLLARRGAKVIDADAVSREVTRPGSRTLSKLVERFGQEILLPSGELDRKALSEAAFSSLDDVSDLNRITHPAIVEAIRARLEGFERLGYDGIVAVEAALIIEEGGARDIYDVIVAVVCSESTRRARMERLAGDQASALIKRYGSQLPDSEKARRSDYVVRNDGGFDELESKADELWKWLNDKKAAR